MGLEIPQPPPTEAGRASRRICSTAWQVRRFSLYSLPSLSGISFHPLVLLPHCALLCSNSIFLIAAFKMLTGRLLGPPNFSSPSWTIRAPPDSGPFEKVLLKSTKHSLHQISYLTVENKQMVQTWLPFHKATLTTPSHLLVLHNFGNRLQDYFFHHLSMVYKGLTSL